MAVVLALLSSALWGGADFLGGLLSKRRPAIAVAGASQTAGFAAVTLVALISGGFARPAGWLLWGALAGVSGASGLICFYAALAAGTMGVVAPIAALGGIVPLAAGVISGERPSPTAVAGIVLALAGAVAASGPELRGGSGGRPVALAATAGLAFGLTLVFIAHGARSDSLMTLWGMRCTSVLGFALAALALRSAGGLRPRDLGPVCLVGVADAGANLLFALATERGLLSITSVLGSLYPVATVLLARVVLGERLVRIQQLGVVGALGGVALASLG